MSNNTDSGHAKNAFNLDKLNQVITSFGAAYNPVNPKITLTALQTLQTNAYAKLSEYAQAYTSWKNATNKREIAFEDIDKFATKLLGALQSTGAAKQTIDDFNALVKKMRGDGKVKKPVVATIPNPDPNATTTPLAKTISTSQQSYDNKVQHFEQMLLLLQGEPLYVPNETIYTVSKLSSKLIELAKSNNDANQAYVNLHIARIARNTFFYHETSGLLDIIRQVKAYVKSIYGASSQHFSEVTAIPFFRLLSTNQAN